VRSIFDRLRAYFVLTSTYNCRRFIVKNYAFSRSSSNRVIFYFIIRYERIGIRNVVPSKRRSFVYVPSYKRDNYRSFVIIIFGYGTKPVPRIYYLIDFATARRFIITTAKIIPVTQFGDNKQRAALLLLYIFEKHAF